MEGMLNHTRGISTDENVIDSPCWGSPTRCLLSDLLKVVDRSIILLETDDYVVLNKPPDLRMDGDYPATVHKLLTFWYPPKSIENTPNLMELISNLQKSNDLKDAQLRPCHQLDYATSGALLVARNRKAAGLACESFRDRTTQKVYLALVHSHVDVHAKSNVLTVTKKDLFHQIRLFDQQLADRRKAHRKTFNGYQPPSAIFMKWKDFTGRGGKRRRDVDMMHQIADQITEPERARMIGMAWGEAKTNPRWKLVFEDASKVYNQSLLDDNEIPNESRKMLELPTVFRLEEDGGSNVFYVKASLAQHPTSFAMVVQADSEQNADHHGPLLDFKLAITRCTILKQLTLKSVPVTKMKLEPLTGRRHQLRCHMAVVNAPIVGDVTYEGCLPHDLSERMCLHAFKLKIPGIVDIEAPDPFVTTTTENNMGSLDIRLL